MIDLNSPIYDPDPERSEREIMEAIIAEGRAARRLGIPRDRCPPYRINDWCIYWGHGWRWEDEEIKRRKPKETE